MKRLFTLLFLITASSMADAQIKKCAVISIFGNRNLSDNPLDTKLYEALLKDSSFDISGTVAEYETLVNKQFKPEFPFPFKDKTEVVNNDEYKALDSITIYKTYAFQNSEFNWNNPFIAADGYLKIAPWIGDKDVIKKSFEIFPDVDAVLIAYLDFNIYDAVGAMGISSKKVYANANIKIFNKEGKRIFKLKERASSKKGVTALGGIVLDPKKLKPMIFDSAERLFVEMKGKMPKKLAKMAKKIDKMAGEEDN